MDIPSLQTCATAELSEIHEYLRMIFQTYVTWFTFFITILLGAMAWALRTALDDSGNVRFSFPFYAATFLFLTQILLGIVAGFVVMININSGSARIDMVNGYLSSSAEKLPSAPGFSLGNPVPEGYTLTLWLMILTLAINFIFWLVTAIYIRCKENSQNRAQAVARLAGAAK